MMAKILWLHLLGEQRAQRLSVSSLETCLSGTRYGQGHDVLIHDAEVGLPSAARKISWDGIVLGPTFLCARYSSAFLSKVRRRYDWIADSPALKIALPQDDYDCSAVLDRWLVEWNVDVCYSVLPRFWNVLYPGYARTGMLVPSYTGFVDEKWVKPFRKLRSSRQRQWDVVYRASRLPANFGSLGILKFEIAERFTRAVAARGANLRMDIKTGPQVLTGVSWHGFLENSCFTLATPSGSSLLDQDGRYRQCVALQDDDVSFEVVANKCFPGQDRRYSFESIAPRHLEAGILGTVQLAVPGDYSGILEPNVHYIPLEQDLSNIDQVIERMSEATFVARIQAAAYERVTSNTSLQLSSFASGLLHLIRERSASRGKASESLKSRELSVAALERKVVFRSRFSWARKQARGIIQNVLNGIGLAATLRKFRDFIRSRS